MTLYQLHTLLHRAEHTDTLEECAQVLHDIREQAPEVCQEILASKAAQLYHAQSLEEIFGSPVMQEYGLEEDKLRAYIKNANTMQIFQGFSQAQKIYQSINDAEPDKASQLYQVVTGTLEGLDHLLQKLQEDFGPLTVKVERIGTEGSGQETGEEQETEEDFEPHFYQLAATAVAKYLNFLIGDLPDEELATDKFHEKYTKMRGNIEHYQKKAHFPEGDDSENNGLNKVLANVEINYKRYVDRVREKIEQQQDDLHKLCIVVKAQEERFQDGEAVFQMVFSNFYHFSLRYGRLLEESEKTMRETRQHILRKALELQAESLPRIA